MCLPSLNPSIQSNTHQRLIEEALALWKLPLPAHRNEWNSIPSDPRLISSFWRHFSPTDPRSTQGRIQRVHTELHLNSVHALRWIKLLSGWFICVLNCVLFCLLKTSSDSNAFHVTTTTTVIFYLKLNVNHLEKQRTELIIIFLFCTSSDLWCITQWLLSSYFLF